jgi:hypothetical protein
MRSVKENSANWTFDSKQISAVGCSNNLNRPKTITSEPKTVYLAHADRGDARANRLGNNGDHVVIHSIFGEQSLTEMITEFADKVKLFAN